MIEEYEEEGGVKLSDIFNEMKRRLLGTEYDPYSVPNIRKILENHYTDVITVVKGLALFRESTERILDSHSRQLLTGKVEDRAKLTVLKAAELLRAEIMELRINLPTDSYFCLEDLTKEKMVDFLPHLLRVFLEGLYSRRATKDDKKIASIGQILINFTPKKNKVTVPLIMALTALIHKRTASKTLIDILSSFGLSETYTEVLRFNKNLAVLGSESIESSELWSNIFATDNADAIVETDDGKGSVNITGRIMATTSPQQELARLIPRRIVTTEEINSLKATVLKPFYPGMLKNSTDTFSVWIPEDSKIMLTAVDYIRAINVTSDPNTPSFYGAIRQLLQGNPVRTPSHTVVPLTFIDLKADDLTSIRTALEEAIECSASQQKHAIMVFDLPLCVKALQIKFSLGLNVTIMIGNFHTQFAFLAAIGFIMKHTGLESILNITFSDTSIAKIMAGKNYRRCLKAHTIVSTALKIVLTKQVTFSYHK